MAGVDEGVITCDVECQAAFADALEKGRNLGGMANQIVKIPTENWDIDQLRELDVERLEQLIEQKIGNIERTLPRRLDGMEGMSEAEVERRFDRQVSDPELMDTLKQLANGEISQTEAGEKISERLNEWKDEVDTAFETARTPPEAVPAAPVPEAAAPTAPVAPGG